MNPTSVKLSNSKTSQLIEVLFSSIEKDTIDESEIITQDKFPYLLCLPAENVVALLDFTDVSPYVIWYFDEKLNFSGKGFSLNLGKGYCRIQIRTKYMVLWNRESQYCKDYEAFKCEKINLME
ncbi:hypothetical protein [Aequorivita sediminis]|uniref:hypothetical protein n=1 Tax=Aequorivita sediminis TaxID=3073653 RepID=UPI0028A8D6AB|nr:hypothetical protein [Aequorivita sp. F6058]